MPRLSLSRLISAVLRGLLISIGVTLAGLLLLSLILLEKEEPLSSSKLQYLIITITLGSVFMGSLIAARYSQVRGLVIGFLVGLSYAFLSFTIGRALTHEEITFLFMFNKLLASILAGSIGGLVGVNL